MYSGEYRIKSLPSFRLGMNTRQSPEEISDFELADCENFSVENDNMVTAPGYVLWDDDAANHAGPYWGGFSFRSAAGTQVTIRQRQDKLEYSPDGIETWSLCTLPTAGSPAATISLAQVQPTFAALNGTILYTDGVNDVLSSTDGITWTAQPTLPKCKVLFNNGLNRIVFAAQITDPFRIDWCDINTPTTISATAFQQIDPNSNGEIVGMGMTPDGTNLLFKRNGVYAISNYVTDGIIDVNFIGNAECFNHHTIATTENSVMWAGYLNVYELIGGSIRTISGKLERVGRNDVLKQELYTGVYYNHKYRLSMPDADISTDYNAQEYVYYKDLQRGDPEQPYVITRNRRYYGCYFIEDFDFDYGRDITLYFGDSRPTTLGSPAVTNTLFAWLNDYRDDSYPSGLGGEAQSSFFVTKFYTENVPYYIKYIKRVFMNLKFQNAASFTLSYRFQPYGAWTDASFSDTPVTELEFSEGYGFLEGYGFSLEEAFEVFQDLEHNGKNPRGIQFKVSTNQVDDVTVYGLAYRYEVNNNFR